MNKLDQHQELVIQLYCEAKSTKQTHKKLREAGVEVAYETVRKWVEAHKGEIPMLLRGKGRQRDKVRQLFGIFDENATVDPKEGYFPELFRLFCSRPYDLMDAHLLSFLAKADARIDTSVPLENVLLSMERFNAVADLELYVFGYLLTHQPRLANVDDRIFEERVRMLSLVVFRLKNVIKRGGDYTVGALRTEIDPSKWRAHHDRDES